VGTPLTGAANTKDAVACVAAELARRIQAGVAPVLPPLPPPLPPPPPRTLGVGGSGGRSGGGGGAGTGAGEGGKKNGRACSNCGCTAHATPLMRRGPNGVRSLCNACGLWYARRGTMRPVEGGPPAPQAVAAVAMVTAVAVPQVALAAVAHLQSQHVDAGAVRTPEAPVGIIAAKGELAGVVVDVSSAAAAEAAGTGPAPSSSSGGSVAAPSSPSRSADRPAGPGSECSSGEAATVKSESGGLPEEIAAIDAIDSADATDATDATEAATAPTTAAAADALVAATAAAAAAAAAAARHAAAVAAYEASERDRSSAFMTEAAAAASVMCGDGVFGYSDVPVQQALLVNLKSLNSAP